MGRIERFIFEKSLTSPFLFRQVVRRLAYLKAGGDPEKVHELAIEMLNQFKDVTEEHKSDFCFPKLEIEIAGKKAMPFGSAAGLDKNADAIFPLSNIFGFQEVGTIIVPSREGNNRPRVAVDNVNEILYNAQGFPSKGLRYALKNIRDFREAGRKEVILASVCGIPPSENELGLAHAELETLVEALNPYVDGFVWNPFSPNTAALKNLRTRKEFRTGAEIIGEKAGSKLKLVKMGPYNKAGDEEARWLDLAYGWMEGGGNGFVAVNTQMVPKDQIPSIEWGYPSAGKSGASLKPFRQRAIETARRYFPKAFIIAAGGISNTEEAWSALQYANALEGYTPYTFYGFGIIPQMAKGIEEKLTEYIYRDLAKFQAQHFRRN